MTRVVLDTNILISAIFWGGKPAQAVQGGIEGRYELVTSKELLEELADRLTRKFQFPDAQLLVLMDLLLSHSHVVAKSSSITACRDPRDNKVLETAVDGKAAYIVTGDPDLLTMKEYAGVRIVTPNEFLALLP